MSREWAQSHLVENVWVRGCALVCYEALIDRGSVIHTVLKVCVCLKMFVSFEIAIRILVPTCNSCFKEFIKLPLKQLLLVGTRIRISQNDY